LNNDISNILKEWAYDPNKVNARFITDSEGIKRVQLRLDLGIFEMELKGRPDGSKPRTYDSLLDYYKTLEATSKKKLKLQADECSELQQEAVQYYYRYLARYSLEDYDGVISDTRHNLELFEFVSRHAENDDLAWEFLQFKPYVCMMSAKAMAKKMSATENYEAAMTAVEQSLQQIKTFWKEQGEEALQNDSYEVDQLNELMTKLRNRKPANEAEQLRRELEHAVKIENFEKAASLRDQLAELDG